MRCPRLLSSDSDARGLALALCLGAAGCSGSSGGDSPVLSFDAGQSVLFGEAVGELLVPLQLSGAVDYPVELELRVLGGSAREGDDFRLPTSPVVIPAGETRGQIALEIVADALYELTEEIRLELSSTSPVSFESNRLVRTIVDDDPIPELRIETASGDHCESEGIIELEFSLDAVSGLEASATIQVGGTAVRGADYVFQGSQTLVIPPGETRFESRILLFDDLIPQGPRTITLELSDSTHAVLAPGGIVLTIDDDEMALVLQFDQAFATVDEGGATSVGLTLASELPDDVEVPLIVGGTAGPTDRGPIPRSLVIPAGSTSASLPLASLDDASDEYDEEILVTLGTPTGGAVLGDQATFRLTIVDDDEPPQVFVPGVTGSAIEIEEDAGSHTLQVALSEVSGKDVSVPFALSGSARSPEDFEPPLDGAGVLVIPAGQPGLALEIVLANDFIPEDDEDLTFELRPDPIHATLGEPSFALLHILDNDVEPEVAFLAQEAGAPERSLFIADQVATRRVRIAQAAAGDVSSFSRSPNGNWIAFVADLDGTGQANLHLIDARGGDASNLSGLASGSMAEIESYVWSPDSRWIAFVVRDDAGRDELSTVGVLAQTPVALFAGVVDALEWEPRNSGPAYAARLAYAAGEAGSSARRLFVSTPGGADVRDLTGPTQSLDEAGERGMPLRWAPDASRVAFRARTGSGSRYELYAALPDGGERQRLSGAFTHAEGHVHGFEWSPDGLHIAFRADRAQADRLEIFCTDASLEDDVVSLSPGASARSFAWQPVEPDADAPSLLAYVSDRASPGRDDLWLVNPDGHDELNVSMAGAADLAVRDDFAWSPDGQRLAYRVGLPAGGADELNTVKDDGTSMRRISQEVRTGAGVASFLWADDASRVAYLADLDEPGTTLELFSAPKAFEDDFVLLSGPQVSGGNVEELRWNEDSTGLVYRADERSDGLFELFATDAEDATGIPISGDLGGQGVEPGYDVQ